MRTKAMSLAAICIGGLSVLSMPAQAWEPTKPIEIIVPAGTGGGADQMARMMQGIITKHNLSKQSVVVINKPGGAGGEGFLDVFAAQGSTYRRLAHLPTARGARTSVFNQELDRLFVAIPAGPGQRAEMWIFRPIP